MVKKIIAVILTVAIVFGVIPVHATAATERRLIETKFIGAQVREKAKSNSSLIAWCQQGELMEYVGVTYNLSGKGRSKESLEKIEEQVQYDIENLSVEQASDGMLFPLLMFQGRNKKSGKNQTSCTTN